LPNPFKPISSNTNNIEIKDKVLFYKNVKPCIFHAPAYSDIDDIIEGLGYDTSIFKARNEDKSKHMINFAKHYIKEIYLRYWMFIIILLFIVLFIVLYVLNVQYKLNNKIYKYLKRYRQTK
jgi:hypothetical protein